MCYSPKTIVACVAGFLSALCLTACGGGRNMVPNITTEEAPRPLVPIETTILFQHSGSSGLFEVYVMDGDGDGRMQVAASMSSIKIQDFSADGQTALFAQNGTLFTMDVDGSSRRLLPTGPGNAFNATFSPDGTQVLYEYSDNSALHVYVLDLNVANPTPFRVTPLSAFGATGPRFNHNGSRIVYVTPTTNDTRIWTVDPDGTNLVLVTTIPRSLVTQPRFNHDGTMICYRNPKVLGREGSAYVINADGTGRVQVTFDPGRVGDPVFSADGTRVFFTSSRTGDSEIYSVRVDGTDARNLTSRPDTSEFEYVVTARGQQVLFTSATPDGIKIMAMNSDGTGQTVLSSGAGHDRTPIVPMGRR